MDITTQRQLTSERPIYARRTGPTLGRYKRSPENSDRISLHHQARTAFTPINTQVAALSIQDNSTGRVSANPSPERTPKSSDDDPLALLALIQSGVDKGQKRFRGEEEAQAEAQKTPERKRFKTPPSPYAEHQPAPIAPAIVPAATAPVDSTATATAIAPTSAATTTSTPAAAKPKPRRKKSKVKEEIPLPPPAMESSALDEIVHKITLEYAKSEWDNLRDSLDRLLVQTINPAELANHLLRSVITKLSIPDPAKGIPDELTRLAARIALRWNDGKFEYDPLRRWTNVPYHNGSENEVGHRGFEVGEVFPKRSVACAAGIHRKSQGGIGGEGAMGALSIVISASDYDDKDEGEVLWYTGSYSDGARLSGSPTRDTRLLMTAQANGTPIRVLRTDSGHWVHRPRAGIRYDGLYRITERHPLPAQPGNFRFRLVRLQGQPDIMTGWPLRHEAAAIERWLAGNKTRRRSGTTAAAATATATDTVADTVTDTVTDTETTAATTVT